MVKLDTFRTMEMNSLLIESSFVKNEEITESITKILKRLQNNSQYGKFIIPLSYEKDESHFIRIRQLKGRWR